MTIIEAFFLLSNKLHCVKSVHIRSYSGAHFPAFRLIRRDTEDLSILSPNRGKCGSE